MAHKEMKPEPEKWGALALLIGASLISGCQAPEIPKLQMLQIWKNRTERSPASCDSPGAASGCAPGKVCVRTSPSTTSCVDSFIGSTPLVPFPIDPEQAVRCVRGPKEPSYADSWSHSTAQALYAVDLESPPSAAPAKVYAVMDGVALVHSGCEQEKGKDPDCGGGLGNHVRILNKDGLLALYAHLESVSVEDGQTIHSGALIGVEGSTGRAAKRHLHFSVHHVVEQETWIESLSRFRSESGSVPISISFETLFCDPARKDACVRKRARVEQLPCGPESKALLRGDWRS